MLEMTVPQVVSARGGTFRPHFDLAAGKGAKKTLPLIRALLEATHGASFWRRLIGWCRLIWAARKGV